MNPSTDLRLSVEGAPFDVPLLDGYVDRYWVPVIGPSALVLARFVYREAAYVQQWWTVYDLAAAVGLGRDTGRLEHTIRRLRSYRWAAFAGQDLVVFDSVPPLNRPQRDKLPPALRAELDRSRT